MPAAELLEEPFTPLSEPGQMPVALPGRRIDVGRYDAQLAPELPVVEVRDIGVAMAPPPLFSQHSWPELACGDSDDAVVRRGSMWMSIPRIACCRPGA
jgi:hypothetical protein